MLPPLEPAGQKADPAARRGGLAARADLPTPQETPPIPAAAPLRKSMYPSLKVRASRARRPAPENAAAPDLSAVEKWSPHRVSNRGNLPPRLRVEFIGPWNNWAENRLNLRWSGRRDLNPGPFAPQANALPVCATPRPEACSVVVCITSPAVPSTALFRTRRVDSLLWPRYLSPRLEWRGSQVVRRGSAKSLCIGSIPIRASNFRSGSGAERRLLHIKAT